MENSRWGDWYSSCDTINESKETREQENIVCVVNNQRDSPFQILIHHHLARRIPYQLRPRIRRCRQFRHNRPIRRPHINCESVAWRGANMVVVTTAEVDSFLVA